jgi:hypothetical protein
MKCGWCLSVRVEFADPEVYKTGVVFCCDCLMYSSGIPVDAHVPQADGCSYSLAYQRAIDTEGQGA